MTYKKGQSGNPKGMKPGTFSLLVLLRKKLQEIPEGEKASNASKALDEYVRQLKAGKTELLKDVLDRFDGRPKASDGELGSEDNPIHTVHKVVWE